MENDYNIIEQIELYIEGKMSTEEKINFEKKLNTDPGFKKEFQTFCDIFATLKEKGKDDLRKELNNFYQTYKLKSVNRIKNKKLLTIISVAASVIILILVLPLRKNNTYRNEEIFTLDTSGIKIVPEYADSGMFDTTNHKVTDDNIRKQENK